MATRVLVAGASGYIGRHVVMELLRREHEVVALLRPDTTWNLNHPNLQTVRVQLTEPGDELGTIQPCSAIVSCLASRTGGLDDARRVEFDANSELLKTAVCWQVRRFVLLSAICVQKPRLAFQQEKRRFEVALQTSEVPWTIVRATAFFKSLSGQIERVRSGKAFLVFGDGTLTACKPIAEEDLAVFLVDQLADPASQGAILPVGGPGPAITPREQAALLGRLLGKPVTVRSLPPGLFLLVANALKPLAYFSSRLRDREEFFRIAHFYATESMLLWSEERQQYCADLTPETGSKRLEDCYRGLIAGDTTHDLGEHKLF